MAVGVSRERGVFADVSDLISCDFYAQPFSLRLVWRLIDP